MVQMTAEEFTQLRGGKPEAEIQQDRKDRAEIEHKEAVGIKQLLLNRQERTFFVKFDEGVEVEVRCNIPKKDLKKLIFLTKWTEVQLETEDASILDSEEMRDAFAEFLTFITVDDELDFDFWVSDDLDPTIGFTLLESYILNQGEQSERIRSFRENANR